MGYTVENVRYLKDISKEAVNMHKNLPSHQPGKRPKVKPTPRMSGSVISTRINFPPLLTLVAYLLVQRDSLTVSKVFEHFERYSVN